MGFVIVRVTVKIPLVTVLIREHRLLPSFATFIDRWNSLLRIITLSICIPHAALQFYNNTLFRETQLVSIITIWICEVVYS